MREMSKVKISLFGKILSKIDRTCENFRTFIKRRDKAIEIFFLVLYTILQILLLYSTIALGLFVIFFLFLLSLERMTIHLKRETERQEVEKTKKEIEENFHKMSSFYEGIKEQRNKLREEIKTIKKYRKF